MATVGDTGLNWMPYGAYIVCQIRIQTMVVLRASRLWRPSSVAWRQTVCDTDSDNGRLTVPTRPAVWLTRPPLQPVSTSLAGHLSALPGNGRRLLATLPAAASTGSPILPGQGASRTRPCLLASVVSSPPTSSRSTRSRKSSTGNQSTASHCLSALVWDFYGKHFEKLSLKIVFFPDIRQYKSIYSFSIRLARGKDVKAIASGVPPLEYGSGLLYFIAIIGF